MCVFHFKHWQIGHSFSALPGKVVGTASNCTKMAATPSRKLNPMNSAEQKEFLQATAWLRPFTRWAAAFSIKTEGFLPASIRNLPLKLVKLILSKALANTREGTHSCKK